jgi:hypothetical protein
MFKVAYIEELRLGLKRQFGVVNKDNALIYFLRL